jgi:hypothetical protein
VVWIYLIRVVPLVGSCEQNNEALGSINSGELFDQLSDC